MTQPSTPATPARRSNPWRTFNITLAAGVALLLGIMAYDRYGPKPEPGGEEATAACENFVLDRLKSPSSADFGGSTYTVAGNRYVVTGTVEADNSFGAHIRSEYRCVVDLTGTSFRLVNISIS